MKTFWLILLQITLSIIDSYREMHLPACGYVVCEATFLAWLNFHMSFGVQCFSAYNQFTTTQIFLNCLIFCAHNLPQGKLFTPTNISIWLFKIESQKLSFFKIKSHFDRLKFAILISCLTYYFLCTLFFVYLYNFAYETCSVKSIKIHMKHNFFLKIFHLLIKNHYFIPKKLALNASISPE